MNCAPGEKVGSGLFAIVDFASIAFADKRAFVDLFGDCLWYRDKFKTAGLLQLLIKGTVKKLGSVFLCLADWLHRIVDDAEADESDFLGRGALCDGGGGYGNAD